MCAIFSTQNYDRFIELYRQNISRGDFSYGFAFRDRFNGKFYIEKGPGTATFFADKKLMNKYDYFIGHTQAPTSGVRIYSNETTHPFRFGEIHVAHNGVLTNEKDLKLELDKSIINNKNPYNEVDSSVIPSLIYIQLHQYAKEYKGISNVLSKLKGTHSTWIVDNSELKANLYFGRVGSTLFMNRKTCEISSTKVLGIDEEVPEGELFRIDPPAIESYDKFVNNSPFFTL